MVDAKPVPTESEVQQKLEQLAIHLDPRIDYRLENLFPRLTGWGSANQIKSKAKLLKLLEPVLVDVLRPGEQVLYAAKGVQHSLLENYFMGALWASLLNQTVFVLTNTRLLMMRSNSKGKPLHTFWMIYYSEIDKFKGSWTRTLNLKLKDKRKMVFTGFPKADRKAMVEVFESALQGYREHGFQPETTQSLENLCSHCFERVPKRQHECDDCGATFWKPSAVALRSFIFPSWGDFVLGHYTLAAFELLGYGLSWVLLVLPAFDGLRQGGLAEALIGMVLILIFEHGVDAGIAYSVARKGLHPRSGPQPHWNDEPDELLEESELGPGSVPVEG